MYVANATTAKASQKCPKLILVCSNEIRLNLMPVARFDGPHRHPSYVLHAAFVLCETQQYRRTPRCRGGSCLRGDRLHVVLTLSPYCCFSVITPGAQKTAPDARNLGLIRTTGRATLHRYGLVLPADNQAPINVYAALPASFSRRI